MALLDLGRGSPKARLTTKLTSIFPLIHRELEKDAELYYFFDRLYRTVDGASSRPPPGVGGLLAARVFVKGADLDLPRTRELLGFQGASQPLSSSGTGHISRKPWELVGQATLSHFEMVTSFNRFLPG